MVSKERAFKFSNNYLEKMASLEIYLDKPLLRDIFCVSMCSGDRVFRLILPIGIEVDIGY